MKKAVFLDRDGVIIREVDHIRSVKQLRLLPGAAKAIKKLNRSGFSVVIVCNQAAVAKNICSEEQAWEIHRAMISRLKKRGALIDGAYYCFHHPYAVLAKYLLQCQCRKPGTGLIKKAARELDIALDKSFLVGDKTSDILAGKRAGLKTILVKTGYAGKDGLHKVKPDFTARNLGAVVNILTVA